MGTIQTFSFDPVEDWDIAEILSKQKNISAYIRETIRFYEKHKNGFPAEEILSRLRSIDEKLKAGIPISLPDDETTPDQPNYLSDILGQIEGGDFG